MLLQGDFIVLPWGVGTAHSIFPCYYSYSFAYKHQIVLQEMGKMPHLKTENMPAELGVFFAEFECTDATVE